jgi:S-adenosylmethionine:tRNA ribosyltransferase-isomerase
MASGSAHHLSGNPAASPQADAIAPPPNDWQLAAYDYELPSDRIAQHPADPRDTSRLLVVDADPAYQHQQFRDLPDLLQAGDLLVLNDTSVIPARLWGRKTSGAMVEVLLLEARSPETWLALVRPGKRVKVGTTLIFDPNPDDPPDAAWPTLTAEVIASDPATGGRILQFQLPEGVTSLLNHLRHWGRIPLPPYITEATAADGDRYQTVYADRPGSAAAPTAGLHFTPALFERLAAAGIGWTFATLHVGVGTFRPVESEDITQHTMHEEWMELSAATVAKVQATRAQGGRIIAVGTTSVRLLESAAQSGTLQPFQGKTDLFIYPGYQWRVVDGMITNFHLPRSSLMMLVGALVGRSRLLDLYRIALEAPAEPWGVPYRFYSFGDAMLILPSARATIPPFAVPPSTAPSPAGSGLSDPGEVD